MYNLCGQTVQFRRSHCSILAVALFNSKRSGCSTLAEYSLKEIINKYLVESEYSGRMNTCSTCAAEVFNLARRIQRDMKN